MHRSWLWILPLIVFATPGSSNLDHDAPSAVQAVQGLIRRRLGQAYVSQIKLVHHPHDVSSTQQQQQQQQQHATANNSTTNNVIVSPLLDWWAMEEPLILVGTSATALSSALQYYLKYVLHTHMDWHGDQADLDDFQKNLPHTLPPIPNNMSHVRHTKMTPWTYYANVCTHSYSFWSWDWTTWERHIDWMALQGVNLPLAFVGQEAVWQQTFRNHFGMNETDLQDFFAGPAFLAWGRMGNVQGSWGPNSTATMPLPQSYIDRQATLQHKILNRMIELGMSPVLPSFAGFVPRAMSNKYPNASFRRADHWNGFSPENCCVDQVTPTDPLFHQVAVAFLLEYRRMYPQVFHSDDTAASSLRRMYQCDTYNEMNPESFDLDYLKASSHAVISGIRDVDPQGIWLLQGWLFAQEPQWTTDRIRAYLGGVPNDQMVILDLFSEVRPVWKRTHYFFGKSWIYCVLHNFGGNMGLRGDLPTVFHDPHRAHQASNGTMMGMGITMEGIHQNYAVYDMALDRNWQPTQAVHSTKWIQQYSLYRYHGVHDDAVHQGWQWLLKSVYNCTDADGGVTKSILELRPHWNMTRSGFMPTALVYDPRSLVQAWRHFLKVSTTTGLRKKLYFRHDLIDVTKQALSDHALMEYQKLQTMFESTQVNASSVCRQARLFPELIHDIDQLLSTHEHFLLGKWLQQAHDLARSLVNNHDITTLVPYFDYQARNQITRWGEDNHNSLGDYASKHWAGLMGDYYGGRWKIFGNAVCHAKRQGAKLDMAALNDLYDRFERFWNQDYATSYRRCQIGQRRHSMCPKDYSKSIVVLWQWLLAILTTKQQVSKNDIDEQGASTKSTIKRMIVLVAWVEKPGNVENLFWIFSCIKIP